MIAAFALWSAVAAGLAVIGIRSRRAKKAAGFFAGANPPEVTDVKKYNRAVSRIWLAGAGLLELMGVPLLFMQQNNPRGLLIVLGVPALMIGLMIAYFFTEEKYRKKSGGQTR